MSEMNCASQLFKDSRGPLFACEISAHERSLKRRKPVNDLRAANLALDA
jgi:hypothetical protein